MPSTTTLKALHLSSPRLISKYHKHNTMKTSTIISITTFFLYYLFHPCFTTDTLSPTQPLSENQTLVSSSGTFTLGFFTPTNISNNRYVGIWYHNLPIQTIVWVANRQHPIPQSSTGILTLTTNGTLIITSIQHNSTTILWSSTPTTINLNNPMAQLLDNGNFVVKNQLTNDVVAWQSFDYPTDTLLPGMKLGWDFTTGLNHNLTSWKSSGDPSPGDYSVAMDIRGDPQLVVSDRSVRKWRSGPWTGFSFDSIPEMAAYTKNGFSFDFVNNSTGIYYSYEVSNRSIITRLVVNQTGKTERYVWLGQSGWSVFWYTPRTQCSGLDSCGPNGVCGLFSSPMCRCLKGFKPRSPRDWDLLDGSDGCVRKEPLDCLNGTDGFLKMAAAQLPDTWSSFVDKSLGLDECKARCLMNCSCTAYANADVRAGGSGCILWFGDFTGLGAFQSGQDLYVRLAASEFASSGKKSVAGVVIVIVVVIAVLLLLTGLACTVYCVCRKKKKRRGNATGIDYHNHENEMKDEDVELPIFDLSVILEATDNFAPENKLGQGGFGPVYKGKLEDGLEIAVKRLSKDSLQGIQEFKNEVMLITKLQHRNLVRLLGCCLQVEDRMLIYEYMPNKSLDAFLFDKEKSASLDWQTRYQIILGVARGLLYLHQESRVTIIHRDLKAGNILLDETMNPKISDFGMARIFGGDDSATKTRKVVGTYGYMAPEYAMDGVFSVKSDVYSYGVLVLEIISGQKNRGVYLSNPDLGLLGKAWDLWNKGKILELIDSSITSDSYSVSQVMRCIQMGLLCVQENPKDRPTMSSVFFMLGTSNVLLPQPKQPGFLAKRDSYHSTSSSNQEPSHATDTLTILEGR